MCSEQQQRRDGERFDTRVPVKLGIGDHLRDYFASDISVSGMHVLGELPAPVGSHVHIKFADISVDACVRRQTHNGFGLQFQSTANVHAPLLRYIFSGRHTSSAGKIRPHLVAQAIAARVLR